MAFFLRRRFDFLVKWLVISIDVLPTLCKKNLQRRNTKRPSNLLFHFYILGNQQNTILNRHFYTSINFFHRHFSHSVSAMFVKKTVVTENLLYRTVLFWRAWGGIISSKVIKPVRRKGLPSVRDDAIKEREKWKKY